MEKKQNPFSLYDFLGYFTPGALSIIISIIIINYLNKLCNPIPYLERVCGFNRAELYFIFILLSYTVGHLMSFVSSITVEKYSIWRYGYPSKYMLNFQIPDYFHKFKEDKKLFIIKLMVLLVMIPVAIWDVLFVTLFKRADNFPSRLDGLLKQLVWRKLDMLITQKSNIKDLDKCGKPIDHDFFRFAYHYALENAPAHVVKFQNYVALYGYMRTITLIGTLLFWVILIVRLAGGLALLKALYLLFSVSIFSFLFFMGFIKFYRRFSLEVLMALSAIYPKDST